MHYPTTGARVDTPQMNAGTARELAWVLAIAGAGLLLAALVAFTPWYPAPVVADADRPDACHSASAEVVKIRASRIATPPAWARTGLRSSSRTCGWVIANRDTASMSSARAYTSAAGAPR
jgi:hypothetical protein